MDKYKHMTYDELIQSGVVREMKMKKHGLIGVGIFYVFVIACIILILN